MFQTGHKNTEITVYIIKGKIFTFSIRRYILVEKTKDIGKISYEFSKEGYQNMIVEMVGKIENPGILEYLYTFINLFLEKWG